MSKKKEKRIAQSDGIQKEESRKQDKPIVKISSKIPQNIETTDEVKATLKPIYKSKSKSRINLNLKDAKFRHITFYGVVYILFLLVWVNPGFDFNDPWYEAAILVDSSNKVKQIDIKEKLLEQGGNELRELLKQHPYHPRLYHLMGYYYFVKQEWDSCIIMQSEAIVMGRGGLVNQVEFAAYDFLMKAVFNRVSEFMIDKKHELALDYLKTYGMKFYDSNPEVFKRIGIIYHSINSLDSAIYYYTKADSLVPNTDIVLPNLPQALLAKGLALEASGSKEQALKVLNKAQSYYAVFLNAKPSDVQSAENFEVCLNAKAKILIDMKKLDEASKTYQDGLVIIPNNPRFWLNCGMIMLQKNDKQGALECFEKAKKFDKDGSIVAKIQSLGIKN